MKRTLIFIFLIFLFLSVTAQSLFSPSPKHEVRAVWLTTIGGIDWPHNYAQNQHAIERQQRELCDILDRLQRAGINQVLLQTRIRATTIYPSAYEPWDGCLSGHPGTSPGYDALAYAIDQCHRRGMELHAWVVTIPVGKWDAIGCKRLRQRYPGLVRKIGPEGYLNPEKPQTATYLADICEEITRRYDVDGIHLDYIRYPETWSMRVSADRGRSYITHIVETIHRRVKPLKPYIKLSCAPIGKFDDLSRYRSYGWNAYSRVCQDAQGWLRRGLMDELFPMMYFRGEQFFPFAIDWSENAYGRIVAPGLGIYMLAPSEKDWPLDVVAREMQQLRYHRLGHTYFRSKFFTDNVKGIYRYAQHFDHAPALVPPMTWETSHRPTAPYGLNIVDGQLQWQHEGRVQGDTIYNVYASLSYPVDTDDGRNLVAARLCRRQISVPSSPIPRYYAVTATNRYGTESDPCQMPAPPTSTVERMTDMLACDGHVLTLPKRHPHWDHGTMLAVEDMTGRKMLVTPWQDQSIRVDQLAEGMYQLRSLNARGVTHRLGFFRIVRR